MCKRSVLVKFFPGLFTVLLVITSIAIAKPGVCSPRFIYLDEKWTDYKQLAEDLSATDVSRRGIQAIFAEGKSRVDYLLRLIPNATPALVAGGVFADISASQWAELRNIEPDLVCAEDLQNLEIPENSSARPSPDNLTELWNYQVSGVKNLKEFYELNGAGRTLAVISLDYSYLHSALKGKIKIYKHFGEPARAISDLHLVHPLGIIAGSEKSVFEGIAPQSNIILAQISQKTTKTTTLLEALEWVIASENPPDAILLCTDFNSTAPIAVQRALFACRNAGIIPIVAAGNNPHQITGMAALPCCVTVAAIDQWKQRALFSGVGPVIFAGQKILKPDCVEPGAAVLGPTDKKEYRYGSGTLQAAAHFAGIFLLIKQAVPPETDPEQIVAAMLAKTQDIGEPGPDYETGYGLPDPAAAITHILYPPEEEDYK